jgi:hypothetical protein
MQEMQDQNQIAKHEDYTGQDKLQEMRQQDVQGG